MKFHLVIELGNDAMQTGRDVAEALRNVAAVVKVCRPRIEPDGRIRDINGNTVGAWEFTEGPSCSLVK